jgi:hypothetical protein
MIRKVEMERFMVISARPFDEVVAAIKTSIGSPELIRSPVITTNAGFSRFALALANSRFTVSCSKLAFFVNMPNCGSDI